MKSLLAIAMILLSAPAFAGSSMSMSYTYDSQGRLASVTYNTTFTTGAVIATTTYSYDAAGNRTSVTTKSNAPVASITAPACTLVNGVCTSTISWTTQNVPYVYVCVFNSTNPSQVQLLAALSSGSQQANWIQNAQYTFEINGQATQSAAGQQCNTSTWLASVTMTPLTH